MAIQKNTYDGNSANADPAGNAAAINRIVGFIIIDTVVGGISGDSGNLSLDLSKFLARPNPSAPSDSVQNKESAAPLLLDDARVFIEITPGNRVSIIDSLPGGVTQRESFHPWSNAQIGIWHDEVYYIVYVGPKIKSNKVFPYPGFKMTDPADKIYVEINNTSDTAIFYW